MIRVINSFSEFDITACINSFDKNFVTALLPTLKVLNNFPTIFLYKKQMS